MFVRSFQRALKAHADARRHCTEQASQVAPSWRSDRQTCTRCADKKAERPKDDEHPLPVHTRSADEFQDGIQHSADEGLHDSVTQKEQCVIQVYSVQDEVGERRDQGVKSMMRVGDGQVDMWTCADGAGGEQCVAKRDPEL